MEGNAKSARFRRAAERRVSILFKGVDALGNLANRSLYDYTPEQVQQIFTALSEKLVAAKDKFVHPPQKTPPPSFTFG